MKRIDPEIKKARQRTYKKWYYENVAKPQGKNKINYEKHKEARKQRSLERKLLTSKDPEALQHRRWVRSLTPERRFLWDLWKQFEFTSKKRGLEFLITYDQLEQLYEDQEYLCIYTGLPLVLRRNDPMTMSIDRVDSSKGYSRDNCVLCGAAINLMKLDMSIEQFVDIAVKVAAHAHRLKP